ncbi:gephyrin-like molybdotransferase Glp [Arenimonas terrae]|uniref:Molybdopterin molybdenumtransferase n=1 Tax=Arenimonas terrae TaxID=2546226 RepID=A0A5C4RTZ1_9GAMM|nr:gephyrin-like molybdotransferase Glp [Arenimonas terrae]TNJ34640.1 molybdopterin molybdenumtransferase MoeA [Arenimonas terrae]
MSQDVPTRIGFDEALALIHAFAPRLSNERVPLSRARGGVLAGDLVAELALPGFDNSAMDGFAVRADEANAATETGLALAGEQFAGASLGLQLGAGQCSRITTGAPMPAGADAVLIKEEARLHDGRVFPGAPLRRGANVRCAGEDVAIGDTVLRAGQVLTPARLSLAAALGQAEIEIVRRPTVAVFTTGDELRPPGQPLAPGEIHDSNRVLLQTLLMAEGLEPVAWPVLPDDPVRMAAALRDAAFSFDLVITCGGVSAGEKDHLPQLLREQGQVHFWKVRMKPGMPVLFGRLDQALVLGLPGNPVSVLATFLTLGRTLLDALQGRGESRPSWTAALTTAISKPHARLEFMRGNLTCDAGGQLQVTPNPAVASHRLRAAADANALIQLPEGAGEYAVGDRVTVLPYAAYGG